MKVEQAFVGAVVADSLPFSLGGTANQASAMQADGIDCFVGYLGAMNPARLKYILDAGLAYMPVTFGGEYEDGPLDEIAQLKALGIPGGVSVWLDVEGLKAFKSDPIVLGKKIDGWCDAIAAAGWMPCGYFGNPQPFTSRELHVRKVVRYWKGQGRCVDRTNALAEPTNGWVMTQMFPSVTRGGVLVDANMVGQDYRGRVPTWCLA